MALRAGYKGVKTKDVQKLAELVDVKSIGDGLTLSDDGELSATGGGGGGTTVVANPETESTANLFKLTVGATTYAVPDNSKVYKTNDNTESTLSDADFVPFFDSSASSGSGAPRKSTWSNIKAKLKAYFDELYNNYVLPTAAADTLGGVKVGSGLSITEGVLSNNYTYTLPTAAADTLGGVKVGSGLSITDGVLSATGGGGGSSYTETILYNSSTSQSNLQLNDSIANYDVIRFGLSYGASDGALQLTGDIGASFFLNTFPYVASPTNATKHQFFATLDGYIRLLMGDANNKLKTFGSSGTAYIEKVIGIKY